MKVALGSLALFECMMHFLTLVHGCHWCSGQWLIDQAAAAPLSQQTEWKLSKWHDVSTGQAIVVAKTWEAMEVGVGALTEVSHCAGPAPVLSLPLSLPHSSSAIK